MEGQFTVFGGDVAGGFEAGEQREAERVEARGWIMRRGVEDCCAVGGGGGEGREALEGDAEWL